MPNPLAAGRVNVQRRASEHEPGEPWLGAQRLDGSAEARRLEGWRGLASQKTGSHHSELRSRCPAARDGGDVTLSGCPKSVHAAGPPHGAALRACGKILDDLGDYAEAAAHLEAANRLDYTFRKLDRVALVKRRLIAASPTGFSGARPDFALPDETPVLIVGMPRSGTTLVEQILSSHPAVAAGGELNYWGDVGGALLGEDESEEVARRLSADYLTLLRRISPDAARVTDKLPSNCERLGLIRQVLPRAFVVHCRRHPVDTCWSIFTTHFRSRLAHRGDLVFYYRQYERILQHWWKVLPSGRQFEVDYEVLVTDPKPLVRQLVAFCGLEWHEACLAPHHNRRPVTTASVWQARQPIYRGSVARWRHYEPWLGELCEPRPLADAGSW